MMKKGVLFKNDKLNHIISEIDKSQSRKKIHSKIYLLEEIEDFRGFNHISERKRIENYNKNCHSAADSIIASSGPSRFCEYMCIGNKYRKRFHRKILEENLI